MGFKFLGDYASTIYGQSSTVSSEIQPLIPRFKFQFNVTIAYVGSSGALEFLSSFPISGGKEAPFRVATAQLPTYTAKMTTLNQYNKKRVVQTGVDYNPISMTVYDTRDGQIERFLTAYNNFYYHGVGIGSYTKHLPDVHSEQFAEDAGGDGKHTSQVGLRMNPLKNFIQYIVISRISSKDDASVHTIYNPYIQTYQIDDLDYSDTNPIKYTLTFMYEGFNVASGKLDEEGNPSGSPTPTDHQRMNRAEAYSVTESGSPTPSWAQGRIERAPPTMSSGNPTPTDLQRSRGPGSGSPTPYLNMSGPQPGSTQASENYAPPNLSRTTPVGSATTTQTGFADTLVPGPVTRMKTLDELHADQVAIREQLDELDANPLPNDEQLAAYSRLEDEYIKNSAKIQEATAPNASRFN